MSWVRLDDGMLQNPKIAAVGALGFAVHVAGIIYCGQALTDGFVPYGVALTLLNFDGVGVFNGHQGNDASTVEIVRTGVPSYQSLEAADLWEWDDRQRGWWIHDYLVYNPSAAEVLAERAAKQEAKVRAGRAGGIASGEARRQAKSKHNGSRAPSKHEAQGVAKGQQNEAPIPIPLSNSSSGTQLKQNPVENPDPTDDEQIRQTERTILERIADTRLERANGVTNRTRYRSKILAQLPDELDLPKLRRIIGKHPDAPIEMLADAALGNPTPYLKDYYRAPVEASAG